MITRAGHEPVVIVSLADFESLRETAYLMRSPANARRLLDAMAAGTLDLSGLAPVRGGLDRITSVLEGMNSGRAVGLTVAMP